MVKAFSALCLSLLLLFSVQPAFAREESSLSAMTVGSDTTQTVASVDYTLPYPGLLPDNPLYFLKVTRDTIVGFLISSPLKRAEFNLLQADKRLQAGVFLIQKDKSKTELALSTISKGENYFGQALAATRDAKKQGYMANDMLSTLLRASAKHQEVLRGLERRFQGDQQQEVIFLKKRMVQYDILVKQILHQSQAK